MLKRIVIGVVAFAALMQTAHARRIAVRIPSVERIKQVQAATIGRVVGLLANDVTVDGTKYRVAIVRVNETLKGLKNTATIRVGFIPQPGQGNVPNNINNFRFGINTPVNLTVGDYGLFFLTKHAKADFYTVPMAYDFISSASPSYKSKLAETKAVQKIGSNLKGSLASKDATVRYYAAAMLIQKYRTPTGRAPYKMENVDAEESKLLLTALLNGDWTQPQGAYNQLHPWNMFSRLGLSTNDGWRPPPGAQRIEDYYVAAQAWLTANARKYQLKKYTSK